MSVVQPRDPLQLPTTLEAQLHGFRHRVWSIKMTEAACVAVFAVVAAFLCVFVLDRLWNTPAWMRLGIFLAALAGCAIVPFYLHRWIWRRRRLEQLARLLSRKLPHVGDQLLGVIELADPLPDDAAHSIADWKRMGVSPVVMLTGDRTPVARRIAAQVGVDDAHVPASAGCGTGLSNCSKTVT